MALDEVVARRLEGWRQRLLDLSRSNRLIHYRIRAASSVQVVREDASHLADLVLAGKRLGFDPKPDDGSFEQGGEIRSGDLRLQTPLDRGRLEKVLVRLSREARASLEEQGFHTLHLAFGMLEYATPEDGRPHRAPLLLVPVELTRRGARGELTLVAADDEPRLNPALCLKLEREIGLPCPAVDEDDETPLYPRVVAAFEALAAGRRGWNVRHEVHLALFSFAKIPLYRDLLDHGERIVAHPIVEAIARGVPIAAPPGVAFPGPGDVEAACPPAERGEILDADSSQQAALLAARRGFSYVLQGPPGTGKSQTIANLIAEALLRGERVLFVSEKMAALAVVQRRLERCGLGDLVLELHSRMARPKEVVASLGRAWEHASAAAGAPTGHLVELAEAEAALRAYVQALHAPRGAAALSASEVLGQVALLADVGHVAFDVGDPLAREPAAREAIHRALADAAPQLAAVEPVREHTWHGVGLARLGLDTLDDVRRDAGRAEAAVRALQARAAALAAALGRPTPAHVHGLDALAALARHVGAAPRVEAAWCSPDWSGLSPRVAALLEQATALAALRTPLLARYDAAVFELDGADLVRRTAPGGFLLGWWRRRGARRRLQRHARAGAQVHLGADARDVREAQRLRAAVVEGEVALVEAFGGAWTGPDADPRPCVDAVAWATTLRAHLGADTPAAPALVALARGAGREGLAADLEALRAERAAVLAPLHELAGRLLLDVEAAWGAPLVEVDLAGLAARLAAWQAETPALAAWAAWRAARGACEALGLGPYLDAFEASGLDHRVLRDAWRRATLRALADRLLAEVPELAAFDGSRHETRIARYVGLDRGAQEDAQRRLAAAWAEEIPGFDLAHVGDSETALLKRELQKQRRHLPVRGLVERMPRLLAALKPCLMMSPLSVATFLPSDMEPFDLVVFDEASQIGTEDAVGAIARGRRLVVAGDEQQLPPTRFFERTLALEDEPPEDGVEDLPSVLEECQAGPLPRLPLRWHYRSLDESLIAFSNEHFYDGGLVTFPHPARDADDLGLSFVHVEDGVYEGGAGASRTNPIEAQAVAQRVLELLATRPQESVGVVTFSTPQRDAVLDALDALRERQPRHEPRFAPDAAEPVFVKNLESVQGDERDVILFSVGYGPDADGRVRLQLGPLVAQGGDRRLNVAVTRARRQVTVFASMQPEAIDLERTASRGVALLKAYMEAARQGLAAPRHGAGREEDAAALQRAVHRALREEGHDADVDVGRSSFRVDLAVRHPDHPGRYLVAILTDGPGYARAATTRDRDRSRRALLTRLGWHVHTIWAPDWVRAPEAGRERLLAAIEAARAAGDGADSEDDAPPVDEAPPPEASGPAAVTAPTPAGAAAGEPRERGDLPGVSTYRAAALRARTHADGFHGASLGAVARALHEVVTVEGPVHLDRAVRVVTEAWGLGRATPKARERVEAALGELIEEGAVERDEAFLALADATDVAVRRPGDEVERSIDEIAPAERRAALLVVVDAYLGVAPETLLREAARALGLERLGGRIEEALATALAQLLADGTLVDDGARIARP